MLDRESLFLPTFCDFFTTYSRLYQFHLLIKLLTDWGGKTGSGGPASAEWQNVDRRQRLRELALETVDLSKV